MIYYSQKQPPLVSKKGALKNLAKLTGKNCIGLFFFDKAPGQHFYSEKETPTQVFSCEFHSFLQNTSERLPQYSLNMSIYAK